MEAFCMLGKGLGCEVSAPMLGQILPELLLLAPLLVVDSWLAVGGVPYIPDAGSKKEQCENGAAVVAQKTGLPAPLKEALKLVTVPVEEHVPMMRNAHARHKQDPVTIP